MTVSSSQGSRRISFSEDVEVSNGTVRKLSSPLQVIPINCDDSVSEWLGLRTSEWIGSQITQFVNVLLAIDPVNEMLVYDTHS